jgi:hypothetical protein
MTAPRDKPPGDCSVKVDGKQSAPTARPGTGGP